MLNDHHSTFFIQHFEFLKKVVIRHDVVVKDKSEQL